MPRSSAKRLFTPQMIDRLRPEKGRRIELMDSNCPGLVLRVTENGAKSLAVIFRVAGIGDLGERGRRLAGKQQRLTLGSWPKIGLKEAREKARIAIDEASEGRDPQDAEKVAKAAAKGALTFEKAVAEFVERHCKQNISSWKNAERVLQLHVVPRFKGVAIADIRRGEIHRLLDELIDADRVGTAREVRKHLSKLFNWALDREMVLANPASGLKRGELAPAEDVGRALADDELRAIWRAAGEIGYPFGPYYQLLILTGQRRSEWAEARRSELDIEKNNWLEVPRARYKGRRDHIVPLSTQASSIAEALPAWHGEDYFLFSSNGGRAAISGFTQGKRRLDEAARDALRYLKDDPELALPHYRVHDFRVTCASRNR